MVCPVCLCREAKSKHHVEKDSVSVKCLQCGEFYLTNSAKGALENFPKADRWRLSAWIRNNEPEVVSSHSLDQAKASSPPSLFRRAERMLRWIAENFPGGARFSISDIGKWEAWKNEQNNGGLMLIGGEVVASPLVAVGWNRNVDEVSYMLDEVLAAELEFLKASKSGNYVVSAKGFLHLEGRGLGTPTLGFCAMWFSDEVARLWVDVIEPGLRSAGYEPLRIDAKQHNGKIDDEIVASIRASRFVVADFTGQRGGAYYEAGFAHGLGLPVIFMCRETDVKDLHFDIRQYNCILWKPDELEDAKARLKNRILATLGQGPLKVE